MSSGGALSFNSTPSRRYKFLRALGSGSYGAVAAFHDVDSGQDVAIKRITQALDDFLVCRRTLREVKLMRHFCHRNLLHLLDVLPVQVATSTVFVITPIMDWDLEHMLRKKGVRLSPSEVCNFLVQMLLGLLHLHSGHVIHRDLKPANIFVRKDGLVKIGDLGLSRGIDLETESGEPLHMPDEALTEYVVTRWYRAPEVILCPADYGPPVDIWSIGCILYEMVTGKILFQGRNSFDQLRRIVSILGTPSGEATSWLQAPAAQRMLKRLTPCRPRLEELRKNWHANFGDGMKGLLEAMLYFDPDTRPSLEAALQQPCLAEARKEGDTLRAKTVQVFQQDYDKEFDALDRAAERRLLPKVIKMLQSEVDNCRNEVEHSERVARGSTTPRSSASSSVPSQASARPGNAFSEARRSSQGHAQPGEVRRLSRDLGLDASAHRTPREERRALSANAGSRYSSGSRDRGEILAQRSRDATATAVAESQAATASAAQRQWRRQQRHAAEASTSRQGSTRSASVPRTAQNGRPPVRPREAVQETAHWAGEDDELRLRPHHSAPDAPPSGPPPLSSRSYPQGGPQASALDMASAVTAGSMLTPPRAGGRPLSARGFAAAAPFSAVARGGAQVLTELEENLSRPANTQRRSSQGSQGRGVEAWAAVPAEAKKEALLAARAEAARREAERSAAAAPENRVQEPENFLREVGLALQERQCRRASDSNVVYNGAGGLLAARDEAVRRERRRSNVVVCDARGHNDEDEVVANFLHRLDKNKSGQAIAEPQKHRR